MYRTIIAIVLSYSFSNTKIKHSGLLAVCTAYRFSVTDKGNFTNKQLETSYKTV